MSNAWAERQRRTNKLVRQVANAVLEGPTNGNRLYGLCKLTWITKPYESERSPYIHSTKIPALGDVLQRDFTGWSLDDVAKEVAIQLKAPDLEHLISLHTGFTNFYNAYRNSARKWILKHEHTIHVLLQRAYLLKSDSDAQQLATDIAALPGIPKTNSSNELMRPEYLLTPVCFALDPRLRFPILNGAPHVKNILQKIGATDKSISAQVQLLVQLIGQREIVDAADLDQLEQPELERLNTALQEPMSQPLALAPENGDNLTLKDEADVQRLQQALNIAQRRAHNKITNQLRHLLASWGPLEGRAQDCLYDILIKNYDTADNDLLLEVKSSIDPAQIRMAIGQVYAYWHRLMGPSQDCHTAIVLPKHPDPKTEQLLNWLEIGLIWLEEGELYTSTEWLKDFIATVKLKNRLANSTQ